jgi:cob(I)alamin adenosyltransferase
MKVYTRRGDDGSTDLLYGGRVSKSDSRPEVYGDVDETQAFIGLARAAASEELSNVLLGIERELWIVMAELACNPEKIDKLDENSRSSEEMVKGLEDLIDEFSEKFETPKEFVVPGEEEVSARLDVARTVCRRAERSAVGLALENSYVVPYLNRLSDFLWSAARWQEGKSVTTKSVPISE